MRHRSSPVCACKQCLEDIGIHFPPRRRRPSLAKVRQAIQDARELVALADQRLPAPSFRSLADLARSGYDFSIEALIDAQG